jgi:protein-S-isoprenylcysteine O-methyltransferase Ste14
MTERNAVNLRKWGEEYRQYMKEVPAINLEKGLAQLREGIK